MFADPFTAALLLLALSVTAVTLLRRLQLPPILGYLAVGLAAGPHALGWLEQTASVALLAEAGLVFLLFTIGLEFSIPQFWARKGTVLGLGGLQMLLTTLLGGAGMFHFDDLTWRGAWVAGVILALSSTAIAAKQMSEQLELTAPHGRLALGILLFQDLAVVPVLVAMPLLSGHLEGDIATPLLWALAKGLAAFLLMLGAGYWILRPLFHHIAALHSSELFMLTVLLVSLAAAWVTHSLGLSLELGAFLAGMMLGETEYRHQIDVDVRPFRDVLMGLFFVGVGMKLDLTKLPELWPQALALLAFLAIGKCLLVTLLTRSAGQPGDVALRTGLVLAQGGEFGFVLLTLALGLGLLDTDASQALILALVLSMLMAPLVIRYNGAIAKRLVAGSVKRGYFSQTRELRHTARDFGGHVILCGFGRIGQILSHFLRAAHIPYVALDLEPERIREAHEAGEPVFYGDATHREILAAAGIRRARAVVVTVHDAAYAEHIVRAVRRLRPEVSILARVHNDRWLERLESAGASQVIPEKVEAAMVLAQHLLHGYKMPPAKIQRWVETFRDNHYLQLRGLFGDGEIQGAEAEALLLRALPVGGTCWAKGKPLGDLCLAQQGVAVMALRRAESRLEHPPEHLKLRDGDVLVLQGTPADLEKALLAVNYGPPDG